MPDIRVQHILTLAHLLSRGARHNFVPVTTAGLGRAIKKSQQAASRHLQDLEGSGFIERISDGRGQSVRITPRGYGEVIKLSGILRSCTGAPESRMVLGGRLVSGMGEGAYYMSLDGYTVQFKERIGYVPFPGTLNVQLDGREHIEAVRRLDASGGVGIDGFSDGQRTYGQVRCFAGRIGSVDLHLIRPERTHHDPSVIELISVHDIRRTAGLSDGSKVTVRIRA